MSTWVYIVPPALVLLWFVLTYNTLVRVRQHVSESWAGIDTELKRRYDLVPNLVEAVKGYAAHERQTLEAVTAAREKAANLLGSPLAATIAAKGPEQALRAEKLFRAAGAEVAIEGRRLSVSGDLGRILGEALADADAMFKNDGARVSGKYGSDERRVLHAWHGALGEIARELNRQGRFGESAVVRDALTKGLEPAYNYYGVTAVAMKDMIWIALAALIGYVLYTVWYGYAILYLFEGWGLNLEH